MLNLNTLIAYLKKNHVQLWFEDNRLKFRGDKSVMIPEIIESLRSHKSEVIFHLRQSIENMTLDQFDNSEKVLYVQSEILDDEIIFAPDDAHISETEKQPVYRTSELMKIHKARRRGLLTVRQMKLLNEVKRQFRGTITSIDPYTDTQQKH